MWSIRYWYRYNLVSNYFAEIRLKKRVYTYLMFSHRFCNTAAAFYGRHPLRWFSLDAYLFLYVFS